MILESLKTGFRRAGAAKRMLFIYYLANLFCGLALAMPLRNLLEGKISHTLLGEALGGRFDMNFFVDFISTFDDFGATWFGLAMVVPIFYLLSNIFLSGGALSVFATEEKYSTTLFWFGSAKYFGRFLRLWLMAVPVFVVFFLCVLLGKSATRLIFGADPYQEVTYWAGWVQTGLFALAAMLSHMYFDYARIYAVMHDETLMRSVCLSGLKFMFNNLARALALVLLMAGMSVVILFVYNLVADRLSAANAGTVILLVALQQIYVLFRICMKAAAFAAQTALYQMVSASATAITNAHSAPDAGVSLPESIPA